MADLGDIGRLVSGDHSHHGMPPGTRWLWLAFPESWPLVSPEPGNYTGPGTALGEPGDWFWFTVADLQDHGGVWGSGWLELLIERIAARFVGSLVSAFSLLGDLPLIWTVPDYGRPPMTAFQPHYRLAFGGSLFTTEGWACRLNITSAGTLMDNAAADTAFPALWAAVADWVTNPLSCLSSVTKLDYVKFNEINALGHYARPSDVRVHDFLTPPSGTGGDAHAGAFYPPQVAVCVSLLTAVPRGKAHRGRMYTPALAAQFNPFTGQIAEANGMGTAATSFLNAINAAVPGHGVSIISTTGQSNHVVRVSMGQAFDTMRTRRKNISEQSYSLGALLAE